MPAMLHSTCLSLRNAWIFGISRAMTVARFWLKGSSDTVGLKRILPCGSEAWEGDQARYLCLSAHAGGHDRVAAASCRSRCEGRLSRLHSGTAIQPVGKNPPIGR